MVTDFELKDSNLEYGQKMTHWIVQNFHMKKKSELLLSYAIRQQETKNALLFSQSESCYEKETMQGKGELCKKKVS